MTNTLNTPVEALELEFPMRVEAYELADGSGGGGRHRGGDGIVRAIRVLEPATLSLLTDRRRHAPQGACGGAPGRPGANRLDGEELAPKATRRLAGGALVEVRTPGGGGWGEPPASPSSRSGGLVLFGSRVDDEHVAARAVRNRPADAVAQDALGQRGLARPDDDEVGVALLGELQDRVLRLAEARHVFGVDAAPLQPLGRAAQLGGVVLRRVGGIDRAGAAGACGRHRRHARDDEPAAEGLGELGGAIERALRGGGVVVAHDDGLHGRSSVRLASAAPPQAVCGAR
jgi:hypothetical protein